MFHGYIDPYAQAKTLHVWLQLQCQVTWPNSGSSVFQPSQVRSLDSEVLCSSVSAFQRVARVLIKVIPIATSKQSHKQKDWKQLENMENTSLNKHPEIYLLGGCCILMGGPIHE